MFALAEVERLMEKGPRTGGESGGRRFWCFDGLTVRDFGVANMTRVLAGLLGTGDFPQVLQRLDGEWPAPSFCNDQ